MNNPRLTSSGELSAKPSGDLTPSSSHGSFEIAAPKNIQRTLLEHRVKKLKRYLVSSWRHPESLSDVTRTDTRTD